MRAIAVLSVLFYHSGVSWAPGGFLGVEVFFVLSGFLITSLLLAETQQTGTVRLGAFWARRARRLLPALFAMVIVIGVYYTLGGPAKAIPRLEGDGIATLLYLSNWHQIAAGTSYFAATGAVSPFQHTWSLAIEEQFYLIWPIVVLAVVLLARRAQASAGLRSLELLLAVSIAGIVASVLDSLGIDAGRNLNRVYMGTDTRAASLLVGASLAIALALLSARRGERERARLGSASAWMLSAGGIVALLCLVIAVRIASGQTAWLYPWGLLALDLPVLALILGIVLAPSSRAARLLATGPLQGIGKISYGLYLWHFPLFLWLTTSSTGLTGTALLIERFAVTFAVSVASYFVIEQPIRLRRAPAWLVRGLAPLAAGGALASLVLAAAAGSQPLATAHLPPPPARLEGSGKACTVALRDTPAYGLAPVPASAMAAFEIHSLDKHALDWTGAASKTFHTCPPTHVLLVGDSIAFTIGVPIPTNEQDYGVELANASILGCAFSNKGQLDANGVWQAPSSGCPDELQEWAHDERILHTQEVVVELGYRDEFNWKWNGRIVHLGQPTFDTYLQSQINHFVDVLGRGGVEILFLTVPYVNPPAQPDGSPAPAASLARRSLINSMLESIAHRDPTHIQVLDIDKITSPNNKFDVDLNGKLCRWGDGVHFTIYCAGLLEPQILDAVHKSLP